MPENNFEKRVQQKMEELRLPPSAEVWEEVEKRISKEKKRRRIIFWFFLFGTLLLGGAGWWAIDANKKQITSDNSVVQTTANKKTNNITPLEKDSIENKTTAEIKLDNNNKNEEQKIETQKIDKPTITKTETISYEKDLLIKEIKRSNKKEAIINNSSPDVSESLSIKKEKSVLPVTTKPIEQITVQKKMGADSIIKLDKTVDEDSSRQKKDSVADKDIVSDKPTDITKPSSASQPDSTATKDTMSIAKQNISKSKKNKWEIGITSMVGISKKSKGGSIFSKSADALYAQQTGSGSQAGGPAPITQPATPGNGFSWQIGTYAKRILNTRTGLLIGLNFSFYSTTQLTGAFVDSSSVFTGRFYSTSVQDFYRSGTTASRTNHYYYLQIPVSFHWQINRSVKLPVIFQNGLATGIFIGSDALVYNSASNVFYKDNKSFNKIQIFYQSGLYTKLFMKTKKPLIAGIMFDYQLSKLQKVNFNGGNHLSSFGIQLGWLLKK